jgi:thiol-disulfide isomerase/thioredoxin
MDNNLQKGFAMRVIIAIVAVVVVLGGFVYYANQPKEAGKMAEEKAMMEKKAMGEIEKDAMMEKKDGETMKDDSMMKKDEGAMTDKDNTMMKYSGAMLAGKSVPLLDFTKADYDAAVKTDKLVVLYFYANWCPICKAEFPVMQKVFNELTTDKAIGFRVNYNDDQTDTDEKNLAKHFGVAYQHTKVFVKNGERILKSPEGWDEKRYDMEISKALGQ